MAPPVFIPLPFLRITAFECISDDPINLIEAIKSAATNFNEAHKESNPKFDNATKGAKLFMRWLYAVHKDLVEETRLSIEPDNVELLAYAEDRHSKCILPSLEQISRFPHGINANDSVIQQLIQETNRNNEVCEEMNKIRQAENDWKRDADETKKDRTKDLQPSIKLMIENASATERDKRGSWEKISFPFTTAKHMAALTSSSTSCLKMQARETMVLPKEYQRTCGLGSSRKSKNWHQAPSLLSLSAKRQCSQQIAKRTDPYSLKYILQQKGGSSRVLMTSNLLLR